MQAPNLRVEKLQLHLRHAQMPVILVFTDIGKLEVQVLPITDMSAEAVNHGVRNWIEHEATDRLVWGITGTKPEP